MAEGRKTQMTKGKGISRRTFLKGTAVAAGAMATGPFIITRPGWAETGPIKIGALEPRSGPAKYAGDWNVAAAEFALERINATGGVLGREMKLVVADSEMKPEVATRRANELLLGEKVDFMVAFGGHIAKIVSRLSHQHKKLLIAPHTVPSEITGEDFFPTTFICSMNTKMIAWSLAVYFSRPENRNHTKFYLLNQDYNHGRDAANAFKQRFQQVKAADQEIVGEELFPLLKLKDFAPYITKVMAAGADVVITSSWGSDLRLIIKQGHELGWKVKVGGFYLNDPTLVQAVGSAAVGHVTTGIHMSTVETPENMAMLKAWRARFPDPPVFLKTMDLLGGRGVNAWLWLGDIIKKAGSLETEKLIQAWEGAKFRAIWGEVEMRACDHQMQTPSFVAEIMEPHKIPEHIRLLGNEMPYIGPATMIPKEEITVPPEETRNKRCV